MAYDITCAMQPSDLCEGRHIYIICINQLWIQVIHIFRIKYMFLNYNVTVTLLSEKKIINSSCLKVDPEVEVEPEDDKCDYPTASECCSDTDNACQWVPSCTGDLSIL